MRWILPGCFYGCAWIWIAVALARTISGRPDDEIAFAISLLAWIAARQAAARGKGGQG